MAAHEICRWTLTDADLMITGLHWETGCNQAFYFVEEEETPTTSGFGFCPFCGGDLFVEEVGSDPAG